MWRGEVFAISDGVGIDGELLSSHMNKPRFMSTPIQSHDADLHLDTELSAKDALTFDDVDVTILFGIDLFSDVHVANIREQRH